MLSSSCSSCSSLTPLINFIRDSLVTNEDLPIRSSYFTGAPNPVIFNPLVHVPLALAKEGCSKDWGEAHLQLQTFVARYFSPYQMLMTCPNVSFKVRFDDQSVATMFLVHPQNLSIG